MPPRKKKENSEEKLKKDFYEYFIEELDSHEIEDVDQFISTSSTILDYSIANRPNGGIPVGRITEIAGNEATGKSLLAYHIIANTQKQNGLAVYLDIERAASKEFMQRMGINFKTLIMPKKIPSCIEEVFDYLEQVVVSARKKIPNKDRPIVIVWDSVAATPALEDLEKEHTDRSRIAPEARAISRSFKKVLEALDEGFITLVLVNQLRIDTNKTWGNPEKTTGGKSIAFYSSVRIKLRSTGVIHNNDKEKRVIGVDTEADVYKNKVGPNKKKAYFPIMYDWGIDNAKSLYNFMETNGFITGKQWKEITGLDGQVHRFRKADWVDLIKKNPELYTMTIKKVEELVIDTYDVRPDLDIEIDSIMSQALEETTTEEKEDGTL